MTENEREILETKARAFSAEERAIILENTPYEELLEVIKTRYNDMNDKLESMKNLLK